MQTMGEYADIEIERQIRETGGRMAREHAQEVARARKAVGLQQCARDLAAHDAREAAISDALGFVDTLKDELNEMGVTVSRSGNLLEARQGRSVLGCWRPDKRTAVIRSQRVECSDTAAWLFAVIAASASSSRP